MDDHEATVKVNLSLKTSRFEDDEGTQGVEFKMDCKVDDGPEKALFELVADASMLDYHDLFTKHLAKLAEALVNRNFRDALKAAEKAQAARERVRIDTEALH